MIVALCCPQCEMPSCLSPYRISIALYLTCQPFNQDFSVRLLRKIARKIAGKNSSGSLVTAHRQPLTKSTLPFA